MLEYLSLIGGCDGLRDPKPIRLAGAIKIPDRHATYPQCWKRHGPGRQMAIWCSADIIFNVKSYATTIKGVADGRTCQGDVAVVRIVSHTDAAAVR